MYTVIHTSIRPSTDVEFHTFPDNFLEYVWSNYSETRLFSDKDYSEDGLELTQTTMWVDADAYTAYQSDPNIQPFLDTKRNYNLDMGISTSVTYETE